MLEKMIELKNQYKENFDQTHFEKQLENLFNQFLNLDMEFQNN